MNHSTPTKDNVPHVKDQELISGFDDKAGSAKNTAEGCNTRDDGGGVAMEMQDGAHSSLDLAALGSTHIFHYFEKLSR